MKTNEVTRNVVPATTNSNSILQEPVPNQSLEKPNTSETPVPATKNTTTTPL